MTTARATAPGKVMLAGEYAVLDGALAVLVAVDRRARAAVVAAPAEPSPFLLAARDVVAEELGAAAAAGFDRLDVDTDALRDDARKLGLGSSAAATVAAIGLACGLAGRTDRDLVYRLARTAHARAQGRRGAPGSGADVAASAHGGVIGFRAGAVERLVLPADLRLVFAWTGAPADTATLVAAVQAARGQAALPGEPTAETALADVARASTALATAPDADAAIAAIDAGARAMDALAAATAVPLVPPELGRLRAALRPLGAAAKTTGAGGGDIVVVAAPAGADPGAIDRAIVEAALYPLALALDPTGVDFHRDGA